MLFTVLIQHSQSSDLCYTSAEPDFYGLFYWNYLNKICWTAGVWLRTGLQMEIRVIRSTRGPTSFYEFFFHLNYNSIWPQVWEYLGYRPWTLEGRTFTLHMLIQHVGDKVRWIEIYSMYGYIKYHLKLLKPWWFLRGRSLDQRWISNVWLNPPFHPGPL